MFAADHQQPDTHATSNPANRSEDLEGATEPTLSEADLLRIYADLSEQSLAGFGELTSLLAQDREEDGNPFGEDADIDNRQTVDIDASDFPDELQLPLWALRTHLKALINRSTGERRRHEALRWVFCPIADENKIVFADACIALECRPDVVRTCALYYLWRRDIVLERTPTLFLPMPQFLQAELQYHPQLRGIKALLPMAKAVWSQPGRPLQKALALCESETGSSPDILAQAFSALVDYGYCALTHTHAHAYYISRNPTLLSSKSRNNFSWAKSMVGA